MTTQFQVGREYTTRSIGDSNAVFRVTFARRTAKTITSYSGQLYRISIYEGVEQIYPQGRYSMAPVIKAG